MASLPYRRLPSRQTSRQASTDDRNGIQVQMDYYVGIDVGTGSARACIIDHKGDIVGLASENIGLWQPQQGYYVGCLRIFTLYTTLITVSSPTNSPCSCRNNQPPISGVASVSLSNGPSASIISTHPGFGALVLTLRALSLSLLATSMSLFP
jgi:hypothetical protein